LLILGSGPAGYTAAVSAARANLKPVVISGIAMGGQLMTTTEVDNWPADVDGVHGQILMERFQRHAERFGTEVILDHIHTANLTGKPFRLVGDDSTYTCDSAWACIRCQKCRIDVEATRMALIVLATHLRQIPSGLHGKISTKSGDQF
jgi:thioredoxin reductase